MSFDAISGIPSKLVDSMFEFQKRGVEFIVNLNGRGMIGDEMGLGKTIQAIAIACHYRHEWPILCVCPSSVRLSWRDEFYRW
jgi:SWI/SNF-related matrix-associated actin-dependent regulator 1 of chromatin subfamily A